jgi:hypothetical protein
LCHAKQRSEAPDILIHLERPHTTPLMNRIGLRGAILDFIAWLPKKRRSSRAQKA